MSASAPLAVEIIVALLALAGAVAALVGSLGLLTTRSFFERIHTPTLATTLGAWSLALATALELSFLRGQVFVHALLVPIFTTLTTPVTTIFLMRAALFRRRAEEGANVSSR